MAKPGQEIQTGFSGKIHNKHVTGEPYILMGSERSYKGPIGWVSKSTKGKEVIKLLASFIKLNGVAVKKTSDRGTAFTKTIEKFVKTKTWNQVEKHRGYTPTILVLPKS